MDISVYLSRVLRLKSNLEVEAWLSAEIHNQIKWIRLSRNPAGVALLIDIAQDPQADMSWRKAAIDGLALNLPGTQCDSLLAAAHDRA